MWNGRRWNGGSGGEEWKNRLELEVVVAVAVAVGVGNTHNIPRWGLAVTSSPPAVDPLWSVKATAALWILEMLPHLVTDASSPTTYPTIHDLSFLVSFVV